jgi:hypothetical protein
MLSRDFAEMLSALSDAGAEYLIVGAYAMAAHGRPRATGDLDIWVRPTRENAARVLAALRHFGAPLHDVTESDLTMPDVVLQIGVAPYRIDLMTSIDGVDFDTAWPKRTLFDFDGASAAVIAREDLIVNKRATGRKQDLADADHLERGTRAGQ